MCTIRVNYTSPILRELRCNIVKTCHDSLTMGHPGKNGTIELVSHYYWWPHMAGFITSYIEGCDKCQHYWKDSHPKTQVLMNSMYSHQGRSQSWAIRVSEEHSGWYAQMLWSGSGLSRPAYSLVMTTVIWRRHLVLVMDSCLSQRSSITCKIVTHS